MRAAQVLPLYLKEGWAWSILVQKHRGIGDALDGMMGMLIVNDIFRGVFHVAIRTTHVS